MQHQSSSGADLRRPWSLDASSLIRYYSTPCLKACFKTWLPVLRFKTTLSNSYNCARVRVIISLGSIVLVTMQSTRSSRTEGFYFIVVDGVRVQSPVSAQTHVPGTALLSMARTQRLFARLCQGQSWLRKCSQN